MTDPAIQAFFQERKKSWLSKELKSSKDEEKIRQKKLECESLYSRENWLRFAFENSYKRSLVSHVSKMTHPDTGSSKTSRSKKTFVSPIVFEGEYGNDGLLKTGNVNGLDLDSTGNGTEVNTIGEVGALLSLVLSDGRRFYDHLKNGSAYLDEFLTVDGLDLQESKESLSAMYKDEDQETNSRIKQVYFPLTEEADGNYHQLSILTNSGIVFELRKRLDAIRFGVDPESSDEHLKEKYFSKEQLTEARKARREEQPYDAFDEIYNLTTIGYGGTKPQNISVLNNQNGGKAHLLLSVPPELKPRDIRFPTKNFFSQSIRFYEAKEAFQALHRIFVTHSENTDIPLRNLRKGRDNNLDQLIDVLIERMWQVRQVASEQYYDATSMLSAHQKIWLLGSYSDQRMAETDWLDVVMQDIQQWIVTGYKKLNKQAVALGDAETQFISEFVSEYQEALR